LISDCDRKEVIDDGVHVYSDIVISEVAAADLIHGVEHIKPLKVYL